MRPNEVTIGDWVKHTNAKTNECYYAKVSGICPFIGANHNVIGWAIRFHKDGESLDSPCPTTCDPIPVTQKILEANGFNTDGKFEICGGYTEAWILKDEEKVIKIHFFNGSFEELEIDTDKRYFSKFDNFDNLYVHELQHAFRLCGLVDLADNFVIEKGGRQ
ncbi:MAG: hypothetical protein IK135_02600 [Bacteroidales bacterium]|nr:hypothetical protein [Bacteroidales bacterium]